ncbi:hypothetical protein PAL_GLEAN10021956 [Pteropus alecto]|uniref:Uncharacterized protein n=1 Tax=Pteropus alecto TaxID=9402 RepID=L5KM91_PTEAL|nr:hypothetical protein PAL_GLEAN10021956 [Pteropus alecto]
MVPGWGMGGDDGMEHGCIFLLSSLLYVRSLARLFQSYKLALPTDVPFRPLHYTSVMEQQVEQGAAFPQGGLSPFDHRRQSPFALAARASCPSLNSELGFAWGVRGNRHSRVSLLRRE